MSAVPRTWASSEDQAPIKRSAKFGEENCREEVFRTALDRYIAEYKKHNAAATRSADRRMGRIRFAFFRKFAEWFRGRSSLRVNKGQMGV